MAKIKSYTKDQYANAKKAGMKAKKPKKPKAGASLTQLENWVDRYNSWVDKITEGDKKYKRKEADKKKRESLKKQISGC